LKAGENLELVVRKKQKRYLPKKVLKHGKLNVSEKYTCNVSAWVADTPESNFKPTINLTLSHNGNRFGLCFNDAAHLVLWSGQLESFIAQNAELLHKRQTEAILEFIDFHGEAIAPAINNYTVNTVIQDNPRKQSERSKRRKYRIEEDKGMMVDVNTGEILSKPDSGEEGIIH
jgi:hypothetical protein